MKKSITTFALFFTALVAAHLLMSFTRPISLDEPKQYMLVQVEDGASRANFERAVNQKLEEGWHLQGGAGTFNGFYTQALAK
jgi:hypothetical protein